jgi:hypothetical protein
MSQHAALVPHNASETLGAIGILFEPSDVGWDSNRAGIRKSGHFNFESIVAIAEAVRRLGREAERVYVALTCINPAPLARQTIRIAAADFRIVWIHSRSLGACRGYRRGCTWGAR